MGDENTILTEAEARHLLRRAGFGPTQQELDSSGYAGSTRGDQNASTNAARKIIPAAPDTRVMLWAAARLKDCARVY